MVAVFVKAVLRKVVLVYSGHYRSKWPACQLMVEHPLKVGGITGKIPPGV
jgi:hypothetical protein